MAKRRRGGQVLIIIALILILIVVAVWVLARNQGGILGIGKKASSPQAATVVPQEMIEIVMTTQDIPRGKEISEGLITTVPIPRKDFVNGSFYTDVKEVIGSRSKFDLKAHTPLNEALLLLPGMKGSVPSFDIPKGMVAISIPIGKLSSVSYALQKGDRVNVIASLLLVDLDPNFQSKLPNRTGVAIAPGPVNADSQTNITAITKSGDASGSGESFSIAGRIEIDPVTNNPIYLVQSEEQRPKLISQTLIQDATILQMGYFDTTQSSSATTTTQVTDQQAQQQQPATTPNQAAPAAKAIDVVTLIVTPQDAVTLNYLMLSGANLNLVLRSAGDDQKITMEAVTLQFVLNQYNIPNPAKLPYGLAPRMDEFPTSIQPFPGPNSAIEPTATPTR